MASIDNTISPSPAAEQSGTQGKPESQQNGIALSSLEPPTEENAHQGDQDVLYLHGFRLIMLAAMIGIVVFLVTVETNVAVTSLVAITADLGGFENVAWVQSSYQLGFAGVIIISAKLSDLFGRKPATVCLLITFTVFSAGCAAAQNIIQLIILRGFQGLGGGGCFTLSAILVVDAAPPEKYSRNVALAGVPVAMGTVLGPIIGGAISENTTWRWIFMFNIPVGVLAVVLALISMPNGFPYCGGTEEHGDDDNRYKSRNRLTLPSAMARLDMTGSVLGLGAVLSFTACFMEAGTRFSWDSAYVITLLVVSAIFWAALLFWERRATIVHSQLQTRQAEGAADEANKNTISNTTENATPNTNTSNKTTTNAMTNNKKIVPEPVLPWRFFQNRVMIGVLLVMLLVGGPMAVITFQMPQRFQLVNGLSSLDAGVRLLPFAGLFPAGSMAGSTLGGRLRVPAVYLVLAGSAFQVLGFALLGTLGHSQRVQPAVYGYEALCGFGCGLSYTMAYVIVPFTTETRDRAVGMGAANQFRVMGSAMGLAIATSVFNSHVSSHLASLGVNVPVADILSGHQFASDAALLEEARVILSGGYNRQMLGLCALSAAQIPASLLMWRKKQVIVV